MNTTYSSQDRPNWGLYNAAEIFTIFFMSILCIATTILNGFTIYVIYRDPLKCFRTPLTTFITGIIISDFFTGLLVEPAIAALHSISHFHHHSIDIKTYQSLVRITDILAMMTMNMSLFIFLALAIAGLIALGWPTVYERQVTNNTAKVSIGLIWIYSLFFAIIPEMTNMNLKLHFTIDLVLNSTLVTLSLIAVYIVTFIVFKTKVRELVNTEEQRVQPTPGSLPRVEKDFLLGIFLLTLLLIVTVWPFTIALYIWFFNTKRSFAQVVDEYIAAVICLNIFCSKFLWDPAILILRIPTYRKSMVTMFNGLVRNNAAGIVAYNRHADEEMCEDPVQETIVEEDKDNEL